MALPLDFHACPAEHHQQHEHRKNEVVGHDGGEHDVGKRETKCRQQRGINQRNAHHIAEDAHEEHERPESRKHQHRRHDEQGAVGSREAHQPLVEQIGQIHEEGQQRVAVDIILGRPIRDHSIGNGVEARDAELTDEKFPIVNTHRREQIIIMTHHDGIERYQGQQGHKRHSPLIPADAEKVYKISHRFKKNLTNRKLTGTQMQNMGNGAISRLTPIHKKMFSTTICNR